MRTVSTAVRNVSLVLFFVSAATLCAQDDVATATFRLGDGAGAPGDLVTLPFYASGSEPIAGLSLSVDIDEEVLEVIGIELVYERPDGGAWYSRLQYSGYDNTNETPGNAGIGEGFLWAAVVFEPDEGREALAESGGVYRDLLPPPDVETHLYDFHLRIRPGATIGTTEVRFVDGAQSPGQPVPNVAAIVRGESADLRTEVSAVTTFARLAIGPEPSPSSFVRGDCDGDGIAGGDVTDAVFLLSFNFLGGTEPPCLAACDADGDGRVSGLVTDAIYLLSFSFLGGPAPGAPFPECGGGSERDESIGCATSTDC